MMSKHLWWTWLWLTTFFPHLKSLIKDQVASLETKGIKAVALVGSNTKSQTDAILRDLAQPNPSAKLIYTTPETLLLSRCIVWWRIIIDICFCHGIAVLTSFFFTSQTCST